MAIFNVRISDDLKIRMGSLPELNWSEIVREAIENKIASEGRKAKDREKTRAASKIQDRIAETLSRRYSRNWKGTESLDTGENTAIHRPLKPSQGLTRENGLFEERNWTDTDCSSTQALSLKSKRVSQTIGLYCAASK